jgi:DNA-binding MarR family transcriptional regulator
MTSRKKDDGHSGTAQEGEDEAFGKLLQLVRTVQTGMQNIDDTHGLSGSQLWALWQISARPGLRVSELAKALHIKPSTASNLLDKLELRQLVRRERRDADNRVVCLQLTEQGVDLVKDIPGPMQGRLRSALGKMSLPALASLRLGVGSLLELMGEPARRVALRPKA